jgi:hypothetical protein
VQINSRCRATVTHFWGQLQCRQMPVRKQAKTC